jgi:hypothetical protein
MRPPIYIKQGKPLDNSYQDFCAVRPAREARLTRFFADTYSSGCPPVSLLFLFRQAQEG